MYDGQNVEFLFNNMELPELEQQFGRDVILLNPPEQIEEPIESGIYSIGFWHFKAKIPYYNNAFLRILCSFVVIFISLFINVPIIVLSFNLLESYHYYDIKIENSTIQLLCKIMNFFMVFLKCLAIPSIGLLITGLIYFPHLIVYIFTKENV